MPPRPHGPTVFLAEKATQARSLSPYLPNGCIIVHALGHLLQLADPHDYDPSLQRWSLQPLPIVPAAWRRKPDPEKPKALLAKVVGTLRNASRIVIATDPGMEGELIARELIEYARVSPTVPIQRLWTNALNESAIRKAMRNLQPGRNTEPLHAAAELRSRTDWLEGINLTRYITLACRPSGASGVLSVGRVQSPTLAVLCDREREIREFVATKYFVLTAVATAERDKSVTVELTHNPRKPRLADPDAAARRRDAASRFHGPISISTKRHYKGPPPLFDTASLQAHASASRKWPGSKTLRTAQFLYEKAQLLSYPRTDCIRLDPSETDNCRDVLAILDNLPAYAALAAARPQPLLQRTTTFDATAVAATDHHAIIPTPVRPPPDLPDDAAWLYDRVCRRFLAQFLPDWEHDITDLSVEPEAGTENAFLLSARGITTLDPGWQAVNPGDPPDKKDELVDIPPFLDGETVRLSDATLRESATKPPPRYTDGTLILLLKKSGLGTKTTWEETIETLLRRRYVVRDSARLQPTTLGEALIRMLREHAPDIADLERTVRLETQLEAVSAGNANARSLERETARALQELVRRLRTRKLPHLPMPMAPGKPVFNKKTSNKRRRSTSTPSSNPYANRAYRPRNTRTSPKATPRKS